MSRHHHGRRAQIPPLPSAARLRRLEVSYNQIKEMGPLAALGAGPQLEELCCAANKISDITGNTTDDRMCT